MISTRYPSNAAHVDFEIFATAGFGYDPAVGYYLKKNLNGKPGLPAVGVAHYAEHPSTGLLSMAYELNDVLRIWLPGGPDPTDLFEHIRRGGLVYAHNSYFEFKIWQKVCHERMGWPPLPLEQTRDVMAQCYAYSIPGKLKDAGIAINTAEKKDDSGDALIRRYSLPQKPTKKHPGLRRHLADNPEDYRLMRAYNVQDVRAEKSLAHAIPPLDPYELDAWKLDQKINERGMQIDTAGVQKLQHFVDCAREQYTAELKQITNKALVSATKLAEMRKWLLANGCQIPNMQKATIADTLKRTDISPICRRVLEIRTVLNSASVAKLLSISLRLSNDGRLRGLFQYQGADRTRRFAGRGPQPQNLPSSGPKSCRCTFCKRHRDRKVAQCPWCGSSLPTDVSWGPDVVNDILGIQTYSELCQAYRDPLDAVVGCLRGLFTAAPKCELLCSDFSAIEAVVLAELAGEAWRQKVFRTHGKIYEMSASKISGIPFEEILAHKERTGQHHSLRKKLGKVAELASGYGGWINAWKNFGADDYFDNDHDIKESILKWRADSPAIVEYWGGQIRPNRTYEFFGIEGMVVQAVLNPGTVFRHRTISAQVRQGVLYIRLPSGGELVYHKPRLVITDDRFYQMPVYQLWYQGVDSKTHKWADLVTRGGKLVENIVQAVARDLLVFSMLTLDRAGYPIVLHVHDEIVAEVLRGTGSIENFEKLMSQVPDWAKGWPVRAAGGWRGNRYRKD